MKINVNSLEKINYFLSGMVKVNSLEDGATKHGGATRFRDGYYSNTEGENFISINEKNVNTLSLFIPSTIHDVETSNGYYVAEFYSKINKRFKGETITILHTNGSWFSDDLQKVIIEKITILSINLQEVTQEDINYFLNLGLEIKNMMHQESVSVMINDGLCLV